MHHKNVAFATQQAPEDCVVSLVGYLHRLTDLDSLCIAGGVGLNCSANRVIKQLPFVRRLFVQPAASDRGLALGCALQSAYENGGHKLKSASMGPTYTEQAIREALELSGTAYVELQDPSERAAEMLAEGKIIGWFQGRSEFGPRALAAAEKLTKLSLS